MEANKELTRLFADTLVKQIKNEFNIYHVSGNLADTIVVYETETGYNVEIPADKYDVWRFLYEGVIIPTNKGSYANTVDIYKNLKLPKPHENKHKNYISRCIEETLRVFPQIVQEYYRKNSNIQVSSITTTKGGD